MDVIQLWVSYDQLPLARRELKALHDRADGNGPLLLAVASIAKRIGDIAFARSVLPAAVRSFPSSDHRGKAYLCILAYSIVPENVPLLTDLLSSIDLEAISEASIMDQLLGAV